MTRARVISLSLCHRVGFQRIFVMRIDLYCSYPASLSTADGAVRWVAMATENERLATLSCRYRPSYPVAPRNVKKW